MQGYYTIVVYGTTEELEEFNKKLEKIADTNEILKSLNEWKDLDCIDMCDEDGIATITLGTYEGSTNINELPFAYNFEETSELMAKKFPEYEMRAEGEYLEGKNSKRIYTSKKGSRKIEEEEDDTLFFDCGFKYYYPDTDEFELDDGFAPCGEISADEFRNEKGFIELENEAEDENIVIQTIIYDRNAEVSLDALDYLYKTDMKHYKEDIDSFIAFHHIYKKTFKVPADLFRDDNGEFVEKQVPFKRGDDYYYFVKLNLG